MQYFLTLSWDILVILQFFIPLFNERLLWLGHYYSYAIALPGTNFIILVLGLLIHQFASQGLKTSLVYQVLSGIWKGWKNQLARNPWLPLTIAWLANGALWAFPSLKRHYNLRSSYDLGIFTQTLWNLTHGYGYHTSLKQGANLFSDHVSPLLWIFAPLYRVSPYPETLLILQAFGLTAGGVAVFYLVRSYFQENGRIGWEAALAPWVYWLYFPVRNANCFDFHPEVFMLPLFLWGAVGVYSKQKFHKILGVFALLLSMGAKESAPLVAVGIGLAWVLGAAPLHARHFTRRLGFVLCGLGMFVFWFDVQVVPTFFHKSYAYNRRYSGFGNSLSDWVLNILKNPGVLAPYLWNPARKDFFMATLEPLGFLPLLNISALPAILPGYLMLFLTKGDWFVTIRYHYAIEAAVGLFFSLSGVFVGLRFLSKKFGKLWSGFESVPKLWLVFFCVSYLGHTEFARIRGIKSSPHGHWIRHEVIPCINPTVAIAAPEGLMPQLTSRYWSARLPDVALPGGLVDCAIFDAQVKQWSINTSQAEEIKHNLERQGYCIQYSCGSFSVYGKEAACMICQPKCSL